MAFDEQLRQAFETLTDRVREEIARELRGLTDDLVKQAAADRERAAAEAGDTARTEAERAADARIAEAEDAALARVADAQRAADAIRAIDRTRSLSEILDTLVNCAG